MVSLQISYTIKKMISLKNKVYEVNKQQKCFVMLKWRIVQNFRLVSQDKNSL